MTIEQAHPQFTNMLLGAMTSIDIPPRPAIIDRIAAAMREDNPNLKAVGEMVCQDVSLAASLIRTANSPFFGYCRKARSVHEAIMMLGLAVTTRAIASISLRRAFPDSAQYERFWDASSRIAALSGWLAQRLHKPNLRADDAYTFGLFRDCGIVILIRRQPGYSATLERANQEKELCFTDIEQQELPTDHTVLGSLLAQDWWLPEEMCKGIRHHHDRQAIEHFDSGLPMNSRYMVAISQTAEYLLQRATGLSQTCEWEKLGDTCMRLLQIEAAHLAELEKEASEMLDKMS